MKSTEQELTTEQLGSLNLVERNLAVEGFEKFFGAGGVQWRTGEVRRSVFEKLNSFLESVGTGDLGLVQDRSESLQGLFKLYFDTFLKSDYCDEDKKQIVALTERKYLLKIFKKTRTLVNKVEDPTAQDPKTVRFLDIFNSILLPYCKEYTSISWEQLSDPQALLKQGELLDWCRKFGLPETWKVANNLAIMVRTQKPGNLQEREKSLIAALQKLEPFLKDVKDSATGGEKVGNLRFRLGVLHINIGVLHMELADVYLRQNRINMPYDYLKIAREHLEAVNGYVGLDRKMEADDAKHVWCDIMAISNLSYLELMVARRAILAAEEPQEAFQASRMNCRQAESKLSEFREVVGKGNQNFVSELDEYFNSEIYLRKAQYLLTLSYQRALSTREQGLMLSLATCARKYATDNQDRIAVEQFIEEAKESGIELPQG